MPLYICVFAPPYIHLRFFIKLTMQTPMHGEEEKAEATDMSYVFGPGASELQVKLSCNSSKSESETSCTESKQGTSTPRKQSRGRRRTRNSGRSSQSSPSPIRPPEKDLKKVRLDEKAPTVRFFATDDGEKSDILDPGEQIQSTVNQGREGDEGEGGSKEVSDMVPIDNAGTTEQLSDSGDWGEDFSFHEEKNNDTSPNASRNKDDDGKDNLPIGTPGISESSG